MSKGPPVSMLLSVFFSYLCIDMFNEGATECTDIEMLTYGGSFSRQLIFQFDVSRKQKKAKTDEKGHGRCSTVTVNLNSNGNAHTM